MAIATELNFEVPLGSTAAFTAIEVTPLTTADGVVMEIVGPALAVVRVIDELEATRSLLSLIKAVT